MKKFFKNVKLFTSSYLIILSVFATISRLNTDSEIFPKLLLNFFAIGFILVFIPKLIDYYFDNKYISFTNSMIEAAIAYLLIDPRNEIYITIIIALLILGGRLLLRSKKKPILNPVSLGIGIVSLGFLVLEKFGLELLPPFISWWGVSFAPRFSEYNISLAAILTIFAGIYAAKKEFRLKIIIHTFVFSILMIFIFKELFNYGELDFINFFLEGTFLFAVFIMLVEPKTSPAKPKLQLIYAFIFSLLWNIFLKFDLPDGFIFAILGANIFNYLVSLKALRPLVDRIRIMR